ncbi:hypothetical protein QPK80_12230 [Providencia rettgeri]|nr:hypothetical protein [Providencia rettgeri]
MLFVSPSNLIVTFPLSLLLIWQGKKSPLLHSSLLFVVILAFQALLPVVESGNEFTLELDVACARL